MALFANHKATITQPEVYFSRMLTQPRMDLPAKFNSEDWTDWVLSVHEWLSLASLPIQRVAEQVDVDPYLSTYQVYDEVGRREITKICWNGFVPSSWIQNLMETILRILGQMLVQTPQTDDWLSMTVYGFQDAPLSWGTCEHRFLQTGENNYTVLLLPTAKKVLLYEVMSKDEYA